MVKTLALKEIMSSASCGNTNKKKTYIIVATQIFLVILKRMRGVKRESQSTFLSNKILLKIYVYILFQVSYKG